MFQQKSIKIWSEYKLNVLLQYRHFTHSSDNVWDSLQWIYSVEQLTTRKRLVFINIHGISNINCCSYLYSISIIQNVSNFHSDNLTKRNIKQLYNDINLYIKPDVRNLNKIVLWLVTIVFVIKFKVQLQNTCYIIFPYYFYYLITIFLII